MNFADQFQNAAKSCGNCLCAGLDPELEGFPQFIKERATRESNGAVEYNYHALTSLYEITLETLAGKLPAIKPNLAFFEQYGIGGMQAFAHLVASAKRHKILCIGDGKRGDIGSTAQAYARTFLTNTDFSCDALTANPYLGFDTLEPFLAECIKNDRGLFVLVRTSNPGSAALQSLRSPEGHSASEVVATWIAERGKELVGNSGVSSLGAVVGATHPEDAALVRALMPNALFLVPGIGAQGAKFSDVIKVFRADHSGVVFPLSRGLFTSQVMASKDEKEYRMLLTNRLKTLTNDLDQALTA